MRLLHVLPAWVFLAFCSSGLAAQNYIIADAQTGKILASEGKDEKCQVASLTKVATALVVLDWSRLNKADLGEMAVVSPQAITAGGINPVGLQPGDALSLRDLLYSALMASDNVAATVLAQYVGAKLPNPEGLGPIDNFVSNMNALARTLGMKRTLFLNPSGFDGLPEGEALPYSTVTDIARLTKYAYSEAAFPFYVSQKTRTVHIVRNGVDVPLDLVNTNELLGQDGIDGVKTGRTSKAGDCLILTAERRPDVQRPSDGVVVVTPKRLIVVLTGSRDRFTEGSAYMRQGWSLYEQWAAEGRKVKASGAL